MPGFHIEQEILNIKQNATVVKERERHKTIGLISKSARASCIFKHFFAALCKTTTSNDQIQGLKENVSTRRLIFFSLSELNTVPTSSAHSQFSHIRQIKQVGINTK